MATLVVVKGLAAVAVLTLWSACSADPGLSPAPSSRTPAIASAPGPARAAQSSAAARPPAAEPASLRVRQVIDGDTITVSGIGTVRLIGVDAPEKTGGYRESEPYGDAATKFMRSLVDGKLVRLEYDGDTKDQYNRTLAYVFLEDGTLVNEAIIRAGFAETYRRFEYRRKPAFQAAERDARAAHRGMWAGRRN